MIMTYFVIVPQQRQVPQAATICITLEVLMMGMMVPEAF